MPNLTNEKLCAEFKQGDLSALTVLIENNLPFIHHTAISLANQYRWPKLSDDLAQEGALGLMQAAKLFDPARGTQFLTYAGFWIKKYMLAFLDAAIDADTVNLDEIAEAEEKSASDLFSGNIRSPENVVIRKECKAELYHALKVISKRERAYLWYRFGFPDGPKNRTLKEAAGHFHLTENRAKTTEHLALDNLWLELPWWYE